MPAMSARRSGSPAVAGGIWADGAMHSEATGLVLVRKSPTQAGPPQGEMLAQTARRSDEQVGRRHFGTAGPDAKSRCF